MQNFFIVLNILIFKEVMAIFVPPKSPNIWRPILGPAQVSKYSFDMRKNYLSMPIYIRIWRKSIAKYK